MSALVITKTNFDKKTGIHSIVEAGYRYEFPHFLYNDFNAYILRDDLVSRWYKQLSDDDRNRVKIFNVYN